jgi:protein-S-isoprenylcysteine O-methyltransferase Ste14
MSTNSEMLAVLDTRIPPPVVMLLTGVLMWIVARFTPQLAVDFFLQRPLWLTLIFAGLSCELLPALRFIRARTTVNPLRPQTTSQLVTEGLNRYSRNPMYVGQFLLLIAWAVFLGHALSAVMPLLFALYITQFQILPEERALEARFGDAYANYRARVRRWL